MAHSWIPTNAALARRNIQVEPYCSRCSNGDYETVFHALWNCRVNREVWTSDGFYGKIQRLGREDYVRNSVTHGGHKPQASAILEWCSKYLSEFRQSNVPKCDRARRETACWLPPATEEFKINVDAGVKVGAGVASTSLVVRDYVGAIHSAAATVVMQEMTPLQAELQAIARGLQAGIQCQLSAFSVESDCLQVVKLVQQEEGGCRDVDGVLAHIKSLLQNVRVRGLSFVFREANQVAHVLANEALNNKASAMWVGVVPPCASQAV
ncbi:uncharacterized protein LOC115696789 [Cannabis sativa]|uniref:uncharacterized protein LOC115696789 n=1 Tax=Cannabis sativa TaxID=3483 RepID=UPI0029CA1E61|nr:uncharacterized protein LOC115696789 [Cannabis sativa]